MRSQRTIPGLILTFFMVLILVCGLPAGSQNESVDTASLDHGRTSACGRRWYEIIVTVCWTRYLERDLQNQHDGATFGQNKETNQNRTSKSDKLRVNENVRRKIREIVENCCINPCTVPCINPCIVSHCRGQ